MRVGRAIGVGFDATDRLVRPLPRGEALTTLRGRRHARSLSDPGFRRRRRRRPGSSAGAADSDRSTQEKLHLPCRRFLPFASELGVFEVAEVAITRTRSGPGRGIREDLVPRVRPTLPELLGGGDGANVGFRQDRSDRRSFPQARCRDRHTGIRSHTRAFQEREGRGDQPSASCTRLAPVSTPRSVPARIGQAASPTITAPRRGRHPHHFSPECPTSDIPIHAPASGGRRCRSQRSPEKQVSFACEREPGRRVAACSRSRGRAAVRLGESVRRLRRVRAPVRLRGPSASSFVSTLACPHGASASRRRRPARLPRAPLQALPLRNPRNADPRVPRQAVHQERTSRARSGRETRACPTGVTARRRGRGTRSLPAEARAAPLRHLPTQLGETANSGG